jgi:hypothetical protein
VANNPFAGVAPASYTPGATGHFTTGQNDGAFQDYERDEGGYTPGQYPELEDQLSQGADDNAS